MKYPTIPKTALQVFVVAIFLLGCDAKYLTVDKHAKHVAPVLKVKESDVKFLSYCDYRAAREFPDNEIAASKGIVALTDSHFYIMSRNQKQVETYGIVRIPIDEMEAISISPSQFHLKHKKYRMVVWLNEASSYKLTEQMYDTVNQLFADNGVPIYEVDKEYEIAKFSQRRRNTGYNSGFYSGGGGDSYESPYYGSPYQVGGSNDY